MQRQTHYGVLGVEPSASAEEIRAAFKAAVLRCHPDKQGPRQAPDAAGGAGAEGEYAAVRTAWEVLGDGASRAAYDGRMALQRLQEEGIQVNEVVAAAELEVAGMRDGQEVLSLLCRCGGAYVVAREEVGLAGEVLVPCDTCSLHIQVIDK